MRLTHIKSKLKGHKNVQQSTRRSTQASLDVGSEVVERKLHSTQRATSTASFRYTPLETLFLTIGFVPASSPSSNPRARALQTLDVYPRSVARVSSIRTSKSHTGEKGALDTLRQQSSTGTLRTKSTEHVRPGSNETNLQQRQARHVDNDLPTRTWLGASWPNEPWSPLRVQHGRERVPQVRRMVEEAAVPATQQLDGSKHYADGRGHSIRLEGATNSKMDDSLAGVGAWAEKRGQSGMRSCSKMTCANIVIRAVGIWAVE